MQHGDHKRMESRLMGTNCSELATLMSSYQQASSQSSKYARIKIY
jgi:hypothetical protein